jgi:UDP-N-acetylmuramoyl-tripeptide--D-alanyl-D-alanine ligase
VRGWSALRVARAAGARLVGGSTDSEMESGPRRATIDSRAVAPEDLFVGLRGENTDGGEYAHRALEAGAWGVLVTPEHALDDLRSLAAKVGAGAVVLAHPDPLKGLQALARAWRRELRAGGTKVVAITGSTGKTSTKDILAALLSSRSRIAGRTARGAGQDLGTVSSGRAAGLRTVASPENFNTEIGLPLAILAAPRDTEVLVLELAMRGAGQIAELTAIAEPDVGLIVNVGPAHLELLGSLEAIAAAKAELIAGIASGATVVVPVDEPLLAPHIRADLRTITFGEGGDVALEDVRLGTGSIGGRPVGGAGAERSAGEVVIRDGVASGAGGSAPHGPSRIALRPSFEQAHQLRNLLPAVAAARVLGVTPEGRVDVRFSARRGERLALEGGVVLIDDCYNANPMSMRSAIDDLAETAPARRVAVLGDMLELGPDARRFHREIGEHAAARGVELLVTVGPLAAEMQQPFGAQGHSVPDAQAAVALLQRVLREGDTVLLKASRGIGLERVVEELGARWEQAREHHPEAPAGRRGAGSGRR